MNSITLNNLPVFDVVQFHRNFFGMTSRGDRQFIDLAGRKNLVSLCNRFCNITGANNSVGYFAVNRRTVRKLAESSNITLNLMGDNDSFSQSGLLLACATGVAPITPGKISDDDAFVVEIVDKRYFGNHPWIKSDNAVQKMFNVPSPLYGKNQYYTDTLDASLGAGLEITWSWQAMLDEVWPSYLGNPPTLPNVPAYEPVGFDFRGFTDYQALQIILACLNKSLALNQDGSFSLLDFGVADEGTRSNDRLKEQMAGALDERVEFIEPAKLYYPKGVKIHFHKTATNSGSENVNTKDSGQWYTDMDYVITVAATSAMAGYEDITELQSGFYHHIWEDLPAWVDPYTGTIENLTDLQARATDRADRFYSDLIAPSLRVQESYSALIDFNLCSTTHGISFQQIPERGGAWVTSVFCHPKMQLAVCGGEIVPEFIKPVPPWQWKAAPVYPPDTVLWRNDGLLTSGSATATRDDEYNGTELRYDPVTKTYVEGIYMKGAGGP